MGLDNNSDAYRQAVESAVPPKPRQARPVVILGAGGIVRAAHLPAYAKAGFPVVALADNVPDRAMELAAEIPRSVAGGDVVKGFDSVEAAIRFAPLDAVFDVAVPASCITGILPLLPKGAA